MGKGDTSINYPAQPSYGDSMRESLEAQVALLTGTEVGEADFSDFEGGLQKLVQDYEAPLRQTTAQIDTDVLRQTLLGNQSKVQVERDPETGKFGIPDGKVVTGDDGEPQTAGGGRYQVVQLTMGTEPNRSKNLGEQKFGISPEFGILDIESGGISGRIGGEEYFTGPDGSYLKPLPGYNPELLEFLSFEKNGKIILPNGAEAETLDAGVNIEEMLQATARNFKDLQDTIDDGGVDAVSEKFTFENPYTGKALEEGQTITIRDEDGMIDLLGDKRQVQGQVPDYKTYVATSPGLQEAFEQAKEDGDTRTKLEWGRDHYENSGKAAGREMPTKFGETDRQAGFDAQGNFLGLAALAEDVQAGNLSRQRERDLADVERLSGRFQDVMEDYRPGTAEAVTGAREVLESQRQNLTGQRAATAEDVAAGNATEVGEMISTGRGLITVPTTDTFGGAANAVAMQDNILGEGPTLTADTSFESATVADPLALTANTQFRDELGTEAPDTLRSRLLADAGSALGSGLTDREKNRISEAFKARSTMMGRTFDQSAGIAEAEARVAEDRARQAQNRAFVQSVLGQEAGLQQGDITRGMAQESEQAGLQQRADMADAQFLQQARAAEMQAGMQQDLAQAGIDQERDVLQAQLDQQRAAFNAEAAQQRALADQRQRQQANQFGVGAEMDAERLNAQLAQQGALGYVDAATRLAALEDQTTMDPFAALLNRAGGGSLGQAGQVFGQAGYGLSSGPQYLNPESGLGYISNMAANEANMYAAQLSADASRGSGLMQGLGALGGGLLQGAGAAASGGTTLFSGFCWVAREVYGPMNPQWMHFRDWMFAESPRWFFNLYRRFGERFANWISDKPRIKSIIRKWMDSKIGDK